jgi:alpha-beta hydrolase superfamily lysophospholipase
VPASRILATLGFCLLGSCVVPRTQDRVDRPQEPSLEPNRVLLPDGAALPLASWAAEGPAPRAVILAVHGLNDHAASFGAFDQRGFGASDERGIWAGEDVMADDVWQVAQLVRQRHPDMPLYALGESMGSAVLVHALARHPRGWIDAAILMAPAVWNRRDMPWYARVALTVMAHTWRSLEFSGRSLDRSPTNDPVALQRLREDPLVIHKTRADVLWGIANLMDAVTAEPSRFEVPALILYGGRDEIVPPVAICSWLASFDASGPWQYAFYPEGWHLLTRDLNADTVRADLAAWLANPGAALSHEVDKNAASTASCEDAARR